MGRQRLKNLHRDPFKEREGKRGEEQEQRSEDKGWRGGGDREQRTYIGISRKREGLERKRARSEIRATGL